VASRKLPCACTTLRKASRAVARAYEERLAQAGVTATQFAILRAIVRLGGMVPLTALADDLVLERTSLYRAVGPLRRHHLVRLTASADRRIKRIALTRAGRARLREATPLWEAAQAQFVRSVGAAQWADLARDLFGIVAITRSVN